MPNNSANPYGRLLPDGADPMPEGDAAAAGDASIALRASFSIASPGNQPACRCGLGARLGAEAVALVLEGGAFCRTSRGDPVRQGATLLQEGNGAAGTPAEGRGLRLPGTERRRPRQSSSEAQASHRSRSCFVPMPSVLWALTTSTALSAIWSSSLVGMTRMGKRLSGAEMVTVDFDIYRRAQREAAAGTAAEQKGNA